MTRSFYILVKLVGYDFNKSQVHLYFGLVLLG